MPITTATDDIKALVDKTNSEIIANLTQLMPPVDERHIAMACDNSIRTAFNAAKSFDGGKAKKTKLFRKLSTILHPDKLRRSLDKLRRSDNELVTQLSRLLPKNKDLHEQFVAIPQKIINDAYHNSNDFDDVMNNMVSKPSQTMNNLRNQIYAAVTPIYNEYMRYPEPIQSIVYYTRLVIFTGIAITSVVGAFYVADLFLGELFFALMTSYELGNKFTDVRLLNFMTNNQYGAELDKNITPERMANFAREQLITLKGIDAYEETDEAAITLYIKECMNLWSRFEDIDQYMEAAAEHRVQELKDNLKAGVTGMECLYATLNAFIHEIIKPLPGGVSSNLKSGAVRVLQVLLLLPCLITQAAQQILDPVVSALYLVIAAITAVSCLAVLFVSNIPLYIYDAVTQATPHINAFFQSSNNASSVDEDQEPGASLPLVSPV